MIRNILCLFGLIPFFASCIQDEPLNSEADIIACILPPNVAQTAPKITNDNVLIYVVPGATDLTKLTPEFELTPGATIEPASGTVRDFTDSQRYVVTSQDGKWRKTYTVTITEEGMSMVYDFEHWEKTGKYMTPYEVTTGSDGEPQKQYIWASGNGGFAMTGMGGSADKFPTCDTEEAYAGNRAAKLVTCSTGKTGAGIKKPIASGNLFIGTFDAMNAMTNPMKATRFGLPFARKPLRFTGYYRYRSAGNITDEQNQLVVPEKRDSCQIYAVLYETDDKVQYLYGDDVLTSPNLVALALVKDPDETDTYMPFDVEFRYLKPFDEQKSRTYKYNLAVVFASSRDGARFRGAVGSTLWIDDVEVVCEQKAPAEQ